MIAMLTKCLLFASLLCLTRCIDWDIGSYFKNKKVTEAYEPRRFTNSSTEQCSNGPEGGIEWLISVRELQQGWGEDTARAVITLAVTNWTVSAQQEADDIKLQLTSEITKALLWNNTKPIQSIDLALFIQALVAIGKNPRDFHGFDLVADLLHRVNAPDPHPMLVLALCDANSVDLSHLAAIRKHLERRIFERTDADLKAMALKAFACAASLMDPYLVKFKVDMVNAANSLILKQREDKSFGNLYSTALIVQALIASNFTYNWDLDGALEYIYSRSLSEQSVMGVYYCELALEAFKYPFVKDIYPGRSKEYTAQPKFGYGSRLHYTVRNNLHPHAHFTIAIHVPKDSDFFNVMKLSAIEDSNFMFSHYLDSNGHPVIYAVNGVPNNAEENYYWRLCLQQRVHEEPGGYIMHTVHHSPILESANESHHFIMWYRDTICEKDR